MIFNVGAESGGSWNPALNELGAKNLLKNTLASRTVNGVAFTVNEDGSVTANGTASATITGGTSVDIIYLEQGKEYIISGGISPTKRVCVYYTLDYKVLNVFSHGSDYRFTVPISGNYAVYCWVENGTTCNNDTFYPMLRHASISDDTYEPYAMTNKELTDSLVAQDSLKFQFATDGEGNYGYLKGDDTFVPFKSGLSSISRIVAYSGGRQSSYSQSVALTKGEHYFIVDGQYQYSTALQNCGVSITGCTVEDLGNNIYKTILENDSTVTFTLSGGTSSSSNGQSINIYDVLL